jgi:hypothetical protein
MQKAMRSTKFHEETLKDNIFVFVRVGSWIDLFLSKSRACGTVRAGRPRSQQSLEWSNNVD